MKVISWNLNGIISCVQNGSFAAVEALNPDVICLQEIRTKQQMEVLPGYQHFWFPSERDGYSGTLTLSRAAPQNVHYGFGIPEFDAEGRCITTEYPDLFILNTYVPNSQKNLARHDFRMRWDAALLDFMEELAEKKPVVACGDFNVARTLQDIYPDNMREYYALQGYATEEQAGIETLLESGYVDAFRFLYPDVTDQYTWWSNRKKKRAENRGWRLDYFFVAEELADQIKDVIHHTDIMGSDHCPIELELAL